jgi:hypothetical protein
MRGFWLALLTVSVVGPAGADWLADVWSNDTIRKNGNPAISLNATGAVTVVLPEAALAHARAAGLSVESAVSAFLGRYAPSMCSSPIDMNVPHSNLKVDLLIERLVAFGDADAATQEAAATALNHLLKSPGTGSVPHVDKAFIVDQKPISLSIDYVPDNQGHCGKSPDANF